ncbi:MAG: hypothetical protein M1812_007684 [Candelaria pacifica]|nr:MAG: hypothetical protein M1812_007684 [Candelaria pacifica]
MFKLISLLALVSGTTFAQNITRKPECYDPARRDTANATASIYLDRVDLSVHPWNQTSREPWELGMSITADNDHKPLLNFQLDTGKTLQENTTLPYFGCLILLEVGVLEDKPNQGSCLGTACRDALTWWYRDRALAMARNVKDNSSVTAEYACSSLGIMGPLDECRGVTPKPSQNSWGPGGASVSLDFNDKSIRECTSANRTSNLVQVLSTDAAATGDNPNATYDKLMRSTTPFVMAFWSNSTLRGGEELWGDARVDCVGPSSSKSEVRGETKVSEGVKVFELRLAIAAALIPFSLMGFLSNIWNPR